MCKALESLIFCGLPRVFGRFPQRFPHFLCKERMAFPDEPGFVGGKVKNRGRFRLSDASIHDVDADLQVVCERGRAVDGGLAAAIRARRNERRSKR